MAGVLDAAQHLGDRPRVAQLEDVLDDGAVLAHQLSSPVARCGRIEDGGELGDQGPVQVRLDLSDHGPVAALDDDDLLPAGKAPRVLQLGDGADGGVAAADLGQQHHVAGLQVGGGDGRPGLGRVELDGDVHVRQNHPGGQGQHRQLLSDFGHCLSLLLLR